VTTGSIRKFAGQADPAASRCLVSTPMRVSFVSNRCGMGSGTISIFPPFVGWIALRGMILMKSGRVNRISRCVTDVVTSRDNRDILAWTRLRKNVKQNHVLILQKTKEWTSVVVECRKRSQRPQTMNPERTNKRIGRNIFTP